MTRYEERKPSPRAWLILLALVVVGWVALTVGGGWVIATLLIGILGVISALTMWSTGFYGNIRLTDSELRVGRTRVRLAELYPWGVTQAGERVEGRVIGGGYASTLGASLIGLTRRDGTKIVVQARDPEALRAALEAAMAPFRAAG